MEKKKPLTPEEKAECLALKAIFVSKKKELDLTQDSFGAALGISQAGASHYLNGVNALNLPVAIKAAEILKVSVADFSPRLAAELPKEAQTKASSVPLMPLNVWDDDTPLGEDEVELKFLKTWINRSGNGYAEGEIYDEGKRLRMGRITLQKAGVNAETSVVGLNKGDSNEPVIPDGAAVFVDRSKREIVDGEVYALYQEGEFRVKRLYKLPGGGLRIRSYNREEYPDEDKPAGWEEKIKIEGWVFNWAPPVRKWKGR